MKRHIINTILLVAILTGTNSFAASEIHLKSRRFTPAKGLTEAVRTNAERAKISIVPPRGHVILQLEKTPTINERKRLEEAGIKILSYIPERACFATIDSARAAEIAGLANVRAICEILPDDKIAPAIRKDGVNDYSSDQQGRGTGSNSRY